MDKTFERLVAPFPRRAIHWRVGSTYERDSKKFGKPLAYLDARDVMNRLDAVVGPANWQDSYTETPKRTICTLSIRVGDEWVSKSDGAGDTNMEGEKGGLSDALKRAAVKWGIGRYLYGINAPFQELEARGRSWVFSKTTQMQLAEFLPVPEMLESDAEAIAALLDAADLTSGEGVDAFGEAWLELTQDEQKQFGPWVTKFYPGAVTAMKSKMRDVLESYRSRRNEAA